LDPKPVALSLLLHPDTRMRALPLREEEGSQGLAGIVHQVPTANGPIWGSNLALVAKDGEVLGYEAVAGKELVDDVDSIDRLMMRR
jgi:hypothetical protein